MTEVVENGPSGHNEDFDLLISYCWSNSFSSFEQGLVSKCEGRTDPRYIKEELQSAGFKCWLDLERLGSQGIFRGIHEAMNNKSLKCVVLCLSDEYNASPNCLMELEYAIRRIPCVVLFVGNGFGWRKKRAGYFSASQTSFDFVTHAFPNSTEGTNTFKRLLTCLEMICKAHAIKSCAF